MESSARAAHCNPSYAQLSPGLVAHPPFTFPNNADSSTVKGPSELKLSITIAPSKTVLDLKEAIAAKSDVEKDRQRLIYSGKVLKDPDTIASYKIQSGHTIHMVKGAAKPAAESSAAQAPRLPSNMGTGLAAGNVVDGVENYHHVCARAGTADGRAWRASTRSRAWASATSTTPMP
jgi:hypothetical protein